MFTSGLDFGFTHPTSHTRQGFKDNGVFVHSQPTYESGLTNSALGDRLKKTNFGPYERIIADSAEPGRILELKQWGLPVEGAVKGPNSIRDWIDWQKARSLTVHPEAYGVIEELKTWQWRVTRDGRVLEEPVALGDDAMASLRYGSEPFRIGAAPATEGYRGNNSGRHGRGRAGY